MRTYSRTVQSEYVAGGEEGRRRGWEGVMETKGYGGLHFDERYDHDFNELLMMGPPNTIEKLGLVTEELITSGFVSLSRVFIPWCKVAKFRYPRVSKRKSTSIVGCTTRHPSARGLHTNVAVRGRLT
jgi:hypothetical protein